jgi:hypothetical protein
VTVGVLIAGCSTLQALGGTSNSNTDINVTASGSGCSIDPNIPQISVGGGNSGNLVFHVKPANAFEFVDGTGIDFSRSTAPSGEFSPVNSSKTTITIHDRNKTAGTFKYSVNVVPKAGGPACTLDPTVLNDGTCQDNC